jgi:hypothetical protein
MLRIFALSGYVGEQVDVIHAALVRVIPEVIAGIEIEVITAAREPGAGLAVPVYTDVVVKLTQIINGGRVTTDAVVAGAVQRALRDEQVQHRQRVREIWVVNDRAEVLAERRWATRKQGGASGC